MRRSITVTAGFTSMLALAALAPAAAQAGERAPERAAHHVDTLVSTHAAQSSLGEHTDPAFGLSVGVRHQLTPHLSLGVGVERHRFESNDGAAGGAFRLELIHWKASARWDLATLGPVTPYLAGEAGLADWSYDQDMSAAGPARSDGSNGFVAAGIAGVAIHFDPWHALDLSARWESTLTGEIAYGDRFVASSLGALAASAGFTWSW